VRHSEILRAASAVFAEKGFHAARISDVAARAEVAQGTVYRFFDSKEHLAISILENGARYLIDAADQALIDTELDRDPSAALRAFIREAARFYQRHRGELLAVHSWSLDPAVRSLDEDLPGQLADHIRPLLKKAGKRVWSSTGVDLARLIPLLLSSLSSQLERYGASKQDPDAVALVIERVVFVP
jgi:AcrR family transcriptional regulator